MRYLALDLGARRTGLAVGDTASGIISPLPQVEAGTDAARLEAVASAVREQGAASVVLGLPLSMGGTSGPASAAVRAFGARLASVTGVEVAYQDERLTSFAADQQMARSGRTRGQKKKIRDSLAAAAILRDYFDVVA